MIRALALTLLCWCWLLAALALWQPVAWHLNVEGHRRAAEVTLYRGRW